MGRNAQPIDILKAKGKSHHITKDEEKRRKQAELKLGKSELGELKPPSFIKNDIVAFRYWKQHLKEYKEAAENNIEILSSSDVGILALYCKTYSEYESFLDLRDTLGLKNITTLEDALKIEATINKKMDMLIRMQDRLFLNPLAKVKNVPKKEPKKRDALKEKGFSNV
jgi:phage terminase small subunit